MWCLPRPWFIKNAFTGTSLAVQQLRLCFIGGVERRSCKLSRWGNASTAVLTEYQLKKAGRRSLNNQSCKKEPHKTRQDKRKKKKKGNKNRTYTLGKSCLKREGSPWEPPHGPCWMELQGVWNQPERSVHGLVCCQAGEEIITLTAATLHLPAQDAHILVQSSLVMKLSQCRQQERTWFGCMQRQFRKTECGSRLWLGVNMGLTLVTTGSPNINVKVGQSPVIEDTLSCSQLWPCQILNILTSEQTVGAPKTGDSFSEIWGS